MWSKATPTCFNMGIKVEPKTSLSSSSRSNDLWSKITRHSAKHKSFMKKLRNKRRRRQEAIQRRTEEYEDEKTLPPPEIDPKLEQRLCEALLNPMLELPIQGTELIEMSGTDFENLPNLLQKLYGQDLIVLQSDGYTITSINLESISRLIEMKNLSLRSKNFPRFKTESEEIDYLLNAPSVRDKETKRVGSEIQELLIAKSHKEQLMIQMFQSAGGSQLREFCPQKTREDCRRMSRSGRACPRLHFRRIIQSHTDESLGDCSFLNTCFHVESCKFVHYEIDQTQETEPRKSGMKPRPSLQSLGSKLVPPQWINCDLRNFDTSVLGKFAVIMADPPWDIHMELPYGTMSDDEMRQLDIPALQDDGFIFLWVTGRAMELGRECLTLWGYERIDELVWVKTNQLQRLIRTGRTGHWINHGKEHCLVGSKGNLQGVNRGIDTDVIVAEVRATSRKPDEIYGVIERLSPGTRKIELFGRQHNCQPNWLTLGNQLEADNLHDPDLRDRFYSRYPEKLVASYPSVT